MHLVHDNESLIIDQFDIEVASKILKIRISNGEREDSCIRVPEKLGMFTVKSAYKLLAKDREMIQPTCEPRYWKLLWKVKTSNQIKFLIWRVSHGAIPTRDILKIRMNWIDDGCLFCNEEVESRVHCFF